MTNCFITLFRLKMHMILFLDRLLDVVCTTYCVRGTGNLSSEFKFPLNYAGHVSVFNILG